MTEAQDGRAPEGRPVRVFVVSRSTGCWGAEQRLIELAPRLARHGVELRLGAPPDGELADTWRGAGLPFTPLDLPPLPGLRTEGGGRPGPSVVAGQALAVWRAARTEVAAAGDADVLHSHSVSANVEVAVAGRLARRPTVLDLHDIVVPGVGRRLLGAAARLATTTLANSRATADTVGGADRDDVVVVHPGVDLDRFRPGPADDLRREWGGDGAPLVGVVGRVDPIKRIDLAVEAVAALRGAAADARLVVVGAAHTATAGWARDLEADAARRLGDRVRFVGARDDVPRVLRALDVVVNTNAAEPFGRSVLEAQASGVAVVAFAAGGVLDFVEDGVTGLLSPPLDVPALTAVLQRALDDPDLRRRLGAAGRRQAEERFGVEGQAAAVADLYRGLARRRRTR